MQMLSIREIREIRGQNISLSSAFGTTDFTDEHG